MSFSLISHAVAGATLSPTTPAIDTTGANLIVVSIAQYSGVAAGTLTDSKSNTWTALTPKTAGNSYSIIYYCSNPTVGSGHTFNLNNGSFTLGVVEVQAWSGAAASSQFDVENNNSATSASSPLTAGSVTPSVDNELIVTSGCFEANSSGYACTGFTVSDSIDPLDSVNLGAGMAYLVQTTAGATNPSWTWTGTANSVTLNVATFKAAASAAFNPYYYRNIAGHGG